LTTGAGEGVAALNIVANGSGVIAGAGIGAS